MNQPFARLGCALLLAFSGSLYAAGPTAEASVSHTIQDPALKWGPCPDFLPKGCAIAVLHGDPGKPNVDVFFKVPAGSTIASEATRDLRRVPSNASLQSGRRHPACG